MGAQRQLVPQPASVALSTFELQWTETLKGILVVKVSVAATAAEVPPYGLPSCNTCVFH